MELKCEKSGWDVRENDADVTEISRTEENGEEARAMLATGLRAK